MEHEKKTYDEMVNEALEGVRTEPVAGSLAIDIVTQQLLFVRSKKADNLEEYYEQERFDLLTYGPHPYLPGVTKDNAAFECYYVNDLSVQKIHEVFKKRDYDFPAGRLAIVPIESAWNKNQAGDLQA